MTDVKLIADCAALLASVCAFVFAMIVLARTRKMANAARVAPQPEREPDPPPPNNDHFVDANCAVCGHADTSHFLGREIAAALCGCSKCPTKRRCRGYVPIEKARAEIRVTVVKIDEKLLGGRKHGDPN